MGDQLGERTAPNIIFFLMDTVRASDTYNDSSLTFINSLAKYGTKYERVIAPGTWTAPSHASLFMDANVSAIRGISRNFFNNDGTRIDPWMVKNKFLPENARTMAGKMSKLGYKSVLFSNNPFLTSRTNLAVGFDRIYDVWLQANIKYNKGLVDRFSFIVNGGNSAREKMYLLSDVLTRALPKPVFDKLYLYLRRRLAEKVSAVEGATMIDRGAEDINKALRGYLERDYQIAPHFMFLNYMEAHENYPIGKGEMIQDKWLYLSKIEELNESVTKKLHNGYVKRIRYMDGKIRNAIEIMKQAGMLDNAVVVLTSDHGQLFGEHGGLYHSVFPYEGVAHVPFIAARYCEGRLKRDHEDISRLVSLRAAHKAILGIAEGRYKQMDGNMKSGRYLVNEHTGIIEGWDEPLLRRLKERSDYAKKIYEAKKHYNSKATAVYEGNLKLINFFGKKEAELYDLDKDPYELDNLIYSRRADALRLARYDVASAR